MKTWIVKDDDGQLVTVSGEPWHQGGALVFSRGGDEVACFLDWSAYWEAVQTEVHIDLVCVLGGGSDRGPH